ncbi:hypothetical protein JD844_005049 [Phrynosoma platyrhinos]|uniref:Uncharacterized protein n=1 Tax=Phrynosoma platyrhinos TaxID=52577 RepID=A0ABQ7SE40_PHRPL|nr:hypothetical protein JD844_005049 [Phrynosoma platyrhinos]
MLKVKFHFARNFADYIYATKVRPPRPHVARRPKSNIASDGQRTSVSSPEHLVKPTRHYTVFLSEDSSGDEFPQEDDPGSAFSDSFLFSAPFEWPQPYRTLKESDSADGEEGTKRPQGSVHADPHTPDSPAEISLLESIFTGLDVEPQAQPLSQAKSLEDLRIPKEEVDQHSTFDYQVGWQGWVISAKRRMQYGAEAVREGFQGTEGEGKKCSIKEEGLVEEGE